MTLGIYSAWATVRRNRYFYGNTALADGGFEYHARPVQILVGRIIVISLLILYSVLVQFAPAVAAVFAIGLVIVMPWLIARVLAFNARVTSYRNVPFDFHGRYWGATKAFILGPPIASITLGICAPIASRWMLRYTIGNLRYGGRKFNIDPTLSALYGVWWLPALLTIVGTILLVTPSVSFAMFFASDMTALESDPLASGIMAIIPAVATYFVILLVIVSVGLVYKAGARNVGLSAPTFDELHRFHSDMSRQRYVVIILTNLVVTLVTLGLMRHWAAVRLARFQAEHTEVCFDGDIGELHTATASSGSAVGSQYMELEGIPVAF